LPSSPVSEPAYNRFMGAGCRPSPRLTSSFAIRAGLHFGPAERDDPPGQGSTADEYSVEDEPWLTQNAGNKPARVRSR
jgi:hypothetical protein